MLTADGRFTGVLERDIDAYLEGIVFPIDKPYRWTSADVVRKMKYAATRHFRKKNLKVGHAGTLDPLATGILLVCIGKATKMAEEFQRHDKEYVAGITFGATTPSYDLEKEIDRLYPVDGVSEEALRATLPSFLGVQSQVAPLFSAKSVDGMRAYEMARKQYRKSLREGTAFDHESAALLTTQTINISEIELLAFHPSSAEAPDRADSPGTAAVTPGLTEIFGEKFGPILTAADGGKDRIKVTDNSSLGLPRAEIRVVCSKGTYIRPLARDIGEALGSGAHLDSLRRTRSGDFRIENAISITGATALLSNGEDQ